MSSKIRNYKDLLQEEERLVELLKVQKLRLEADISDIKDEAKPVIDVFSIAGKLSVRHNSYALVNTVVDLIIARMFSKSPFLVWLIFPTILSNLSSHYIPKLVPVVKNLLAKKLRSNQKEKAEPPEFIPILPLKNGHKEEALL